MKNITMVIVFMHCLCVCADTACIGAYVIDAVTQEPIPNIKVSASFSNDNGWKAWTESAPIYHDTQETDVNGFCTLKGNTNIGRAGCGVDKQGQNITVPVAEDSTSQRRTFLVCGNLIILS